MLLFNSVKSIMTTGDGILNYLTKIAFRRFQEPGVSVLYPQATFILLQLANFALGVYNVNRMGLLPTSSSDWLQFLEPKEIMHTAYGGIDF
jgi:hypothetical protein